MSEVEDRYAEIRKLAKQYVKNGFDIAKLEFPDNLTKELFYRFPLSVGMNGTIAHLPYRGGVMDQPDHAIQVYRILQEEIARAAIAQQNTAQAAMSSQSQKPKGTRKK
jgi:hypothetical protein